MPQHAVHTAADVGLTAALRPVAMARNLLAHRRLTLLLAQRAVRARFQQTRLGPFWIIITPLATMAVFSVVFGFILGARFPAKADGSPSGPLDFPLNLLCGMVMFELFAGTVRRSPTIVVEHPNFVKRVVFPLEIFIPSVLLEQLFTLAVGYAIWMLAALTIGGHAPSVTWLALPAVIVPTALWAMGVSWLCAAGGVHFRDLGQAVGIVLNLLFFATPIIYDLQVIKQEWLRDVLALNPLAHSVSDARRVLMQGLWPLWQPWAVSTALGAAVALVGYATFMRAKRSFADVL